MTTPGIVDNSKQLCEVCSLRYLLGWLHTTVPTSCLSSWSVAGFVLYTESLTPEVKASGVK